MSDGPATAGDGGPTDAHGSGPTRGPLERLTRALALVGGALMLLAVAITLVSVVGRYAFSRPVPGDYELVELTCAVGVFLFFPYTHAVNGNICALFFTSGLSERSKQTLDVAHDVIFAVIAAVLTWRLSTALMDKYATGEASILIRIPFWWAYSVAVLSMALLTVVCLWRVAAGVEAMRR
jgi:TRAP-type C4-dicarboxylate transport system permease small subunit